MIDIVCPIGKGSRWQDNELRYSMRSIEKFGTNFRNLILVGEYPSFVKDAIHIPSVEVDSHGHERRIFEKIMVACNDERVSENFLLWNDDYFLTAHICCSSYPNYYNETLSAKIARRQDYDGYKKSMQNSLNTIRKLLTTPESFDENFFDIHCPIIIKKNLFKSIFSVIDWTIPNGYVIKSLYGNLGGLVGEKMGDQKIVQRIVHEVILKQKISMRHIFSISDTAILPPTTFEKWCKETYPNKSRWEK